MPPRRRRPVSPRRAGDEQPHELSDEIFDAAPRTLARSISLQHTVQLIKVTIDVVEEQVPHLATESQRREVADAVLRFSREVAFSAARVYARAAAWLIGLDRWDDRRWAELEEQIAIGRQDAPPAGLPNRPKMHETPKRPSEWMGSRRGKWF